MHWCRSSTLHGTMAHQHLCSTTPPRSGTTPSTGRVWHPMQEVLPAVSSLLRLTSPSDHSTHSRSNSLLQAQRSLAPAGRGWWRRTMAPLRSPRRPTQCALWSPVRPSVFVFKIIKKKLLSDASIPKISMLLMKVSTCKVTWLMYRLKQQHWWGLLE